MAFLVFMLIVIVQHLVMREFSGDAVKAFSTVLNTRTLPQALQYRYETWTSRILIEAPLILLAHHMHVFLWAVIDVAMFAILWWALNQLTNSRYPWLVTALILIYPMAEMKSAGWMATTINYLWPLALMLVAALSLATLYRRQSLSWWLALLALFSEVFATNFESVAAFYLIILAFFSIAMICFRRVTLKGTLFVGIQWLIAGANATLSLVCPGNWVRNQSQIAAWMPDFVSFSPIDKLVMGVNTTVLQLLSANLIFVIFCVVLVGYTWFHSGTQNKFVLGLSMIPAASVVVVWIAPTFFPTLPTVFKDFTTKTGLSAVNYYSPTSYLVFVWSMLILASIVIVLFNQAESLFQGSLLASVIAAGIASRGLMGFSPTLFASDLRTFIFFDFAMIYCLIQMVATIDRTSLQAGVRRGGEFVLIAVTIIAIIGNFLTIGLVA